MMYWNKADYVQALDEVLCAREDHKKLSYYKTNEGEYLTLSNIIGNVWYFNITNYDEARILHTVALIEAGRKPNNLITDTATLMRIAKLVKA